MQSEPELKDKATSFLNHYAILRHSILLSLFFFLFAFFFCFLIKDYLLAFMLAPYNFVKEAFPALSKDSALQSTAILESFIVKIRLALFSAFIFTVPFSCYQLYRFAAPGLYSNERRLFRVFLCYSPLLFMLGVSFIYLIIAPLLLWLSFQQQYLAPNQLHIFFILKISSYLSFMTHFILIFGLIFQLPLLAYLLQKLGWLSLDFLISNRKWAVLASGIFSAITTPPDLFTMLLVLFPLIILYEITVIIVRIAAKKALNDRLSNS